MSHPQVLAAAVAEQLSAWLNWLSKWQPPLHRGRSRLCRKCTASPLLLAAGVAADTPHQVKHALVARLHALIDRVVENYTSEQLPHLAAELRTAELWEAKRYNPLTDLDPEYIGLDPDPEPAHSSQPFLFTLSELAAEATAPPPLPRPPLSAAEKQQLRAEIALADAVAAKTGENVCRALTRERLRIQAGLAKFVVPQIDALLQELAEHLEPPR